MRWALWLLVVGAVACDSDEPSPRGDAAADAAARRSDADLAPDAGSASDAPGRDVSDGSGDARDDDARDDDARNTDLATRDAPIDAPGPDERADAADVAAMDAGLAEVGRQLCSDLTSAGTCGPTGACDVFTPNQDSWQGAYAACRSVTQPGREAAPCERFTDCAPGLGCFDGVCYAYCREHAQCAGHGDGSKCALPMGRAPHIWKPEQTCSLSCLPWRAQLNHCPPRIPACRVHALQEGSGWVYFTYCSVAGSRGDGETCGKSADCLPGLSCDAALKCRRLCAVQTGEGCVAGQTCQAFGAPELSIAGHLTGFCRSVR